MNNVADGYAVIKVGGRSFELTPSFFNISKIGSPKEIIEKFNLLSGHKGHIEAFCAARDILEACGLDGEPELIGWLTFSERKCKTMITQGILPIEHVMILARHCMMHGICGSRDQIDDAVERGKAKAITEFNAYDYVMVAIESLGMSQTEAWNLTMTSFSKYMDSKIKQMKARGEIEEKPDRKEVKSMMAQYHELKKQKRVKAKDLMGAKPNG